MCAVLSEIAQSSMTIMHVWFFKGLREHSGEVAGKNKVRHLFSPLGVIVWHLWISRARHPGSGPGPQGVVVEG